ncbi:MAG TPA: SDR family oxidoreductase [Sulfurihydrogenibium azorense]|uniref:SDR family oxidoreductase n=1 Tax=Sulfurihydrogenibium azorense TaxID=309806 RepID=A0A831YDM1_9AQUI|nr:SDR family oxidoreductase [Sulfurihydrogenibium azorense]
MSYVLILGAKSDIAKAVAREFAKNGYNLHLVGRNISELSDFASDLKVRYGVQVSLGELDILEIEKQEEFYNSLSPKPDGVITAVGFLPDQKEAENSINLTVKTINTNFTALATFLNIVANDFEKRKSGFIIGISSVAGDRGRAKNFIYGSAKAGFTAYLSGLRNRLFKSNVRVITVKPGFVYTKMTKHMDLPKRLTAYPDQIAKDIYNGFIKGKDVIYTPKKWFFIMCVIKHIPERIFKRLDI